MRIFRRKCYVVSNSVLFEVAHVHLEKLGYLEYRKSISNLVSNTFYTEPQG